MSWDGTPKRRTISTRLQNQRFQKRTPGWKAPGQFDRASEDTQIRNDIQLQRIREEMRTTPSANTLLQSAGLQRPAEEEELEIEAVPGLTPLPRPAPSTPAPPRPRAKRTLQLDFIDDVAPMESLTKKRKENDRINCEKCNKTFATQYTVNRHIKRIHAA